MTFARLVALGFFIASALLAFGWFVAQNLAHAVGLIAAGLALELLSGVPIVPPTK